MQLNPSILGPRTEGFHCITIMKHTLTVGVLNRTTELAKWKKSYIAILVHCVEWLLLGLTSAAKW